VARSSRQIRVALVTYAMHCGGMETLLLRLGRYLREHGCEIEVFTTVERGEWFERWTELGITAQHVAGRSSGTLLAPVLHSLRVASRLSAGDFDIVFLHHSLHAQASIAKLPGHVVVIPVLHNDEEYIYRVGCSNPDAWNVAVAVSPKVAAAARHRVPGRPVIQISSGVDLPDAQSFQRRRSLDGRLELIFVGRLEHSQKGVLWLPDILKACRERGTVARLTIVGDGPDRAKLQQKLSDYGLASDVQHLSGLRPEEVYTQLLDAHILLMPSQYEGLPIALLESQACGCVPVVSLLPGITDTVVVGGETGMLAGVGDVSAFAEAVVALQRDPAAWARMSAKAHETIRAEFSVPTMGDKYLQLITDASEGRYPLARPRVLQPAVNLNVFRWREFLPGWLRPLGRRGRHLLARSIPTVLRKRGV